MLAASSCPPLTQHANRHRPSAAQPGSAVTARNTARIAANAQACGSSPGSIASPPSSTASAGEPDRQLGRPPAQSTHPAARRRVRHPGPLRLRPHSARTVADLIKHGADRADLVHPMGQHEPRQQRMGRRAPDAAGPEHEDLLAPATRRLHVTQYPDQKVIAVPQVWQSGRGTTTCRPAQA